jgi:hypothetical protein
MTVVLVDPNLFFIERRLFGPNHIGRKTGHASWHTICGKCWPRDSVSELTVRECADADPDTFVCRSCKRRANINEVRIDAAD